MSTDNKTLADVQPGGRVRLGGQAERARFEAWAYKECLTLHRWGDGEYSYDRTDSAWKGWKAALSAQPSPGGQDALAYEGHSWVSDYVLADLRERAALPLQLRNGEVWHWQGDGHDFPESLICPVIMSAETLRALLAARQPVSAEDWSRSMAEKEAGQYVGAGAHGIPDEPAARQPSKQQDSVALGEATEFCIEKGDRQPVGEPSTAPNQLTDGIAGSIMDLSQFRDALVWAEDAADCSSHPDHKAYRFAFTELLGMIDSKAVGK